MILRLCLQNIRSDLGDRASNENSIETMPFNFSCFRAEDRKLQSGGDTVPFDVR